jgi:hypothetical protein
MRLTDSALVLAWVAIALLAFGLSGVIRQVATLKSLGATHALPPSRRLGPAVGADATQLGAPGKSDANRIILFASPECSECGILVPSFLEASQRDLVGHFTVILPGDDLWGWGRDLGGSATLIPRRADLFETFQVPATPFAVAVGPDGRVRGARPVGSEPLLRDFVEGNLEVAGIPTRGGRA